MLPCSGEVSASAPPPPPADARSPRGLRAAPAAPRRRCAVAPAAAADGGADHAHVEALPETSTV